MNALGTNLSPFFAWLLKATLQGSLLVCLILLIKLVLRNRLPARWHYVLWLVLLVRLSLPWAPQSRLSVYNLFQRPPRARPVQTVTRDAPVVASESGQQGVPDASHTNSPPAGPEDDAPEPSRAGGPPSPAPPALVPPEPAPIEGRKAQRRLQSPRVILPVLWLIGTVVLAGYVLARNIRLWRAVKRERPVTDQQILDALEDGKMQMGVQTIVGLVVTDRIKSPALFGFVRPRILLPEGLLEALSLDELQYVFLHELAHLKRRDIYLGWLVSLLQVLHWFNPLIWFAFRRMRADQEMACDALALSRMTAEEPPAYGRTIVNLLERFSQPHYVPSVAGILEDPSNIERRMTMIAKFKKSSYRWSPLAAILIVVLACVSLPDAERTKASAPQSSPCITLRQVWSGPDVDPHVAASPDGRYLSYVDWKTGDLAFRDIATGTTRRLTSKGNLETARLFALYSVISPDSRLIAYSWFNEYGTSSLCVVGIDGSADRTLYASEDHSVFPVCWSSDGKQVAAQRPSNSDIILVSVEQGSMEVLKTFEKAPSWAEFCYSPDDRFIVYDFPVAENSVNYDIGLFDTKDNSETSLVKHPASDRLLGWLPNSDEILFLSDRAGSQDIWTMKIVDGKAMGSPRPVTRDIGQITPQGLTRDGSLYFSRYTRRFTACIVSFDMETGTIQAESKTPLLGSNFYPEWSPDGESMAYVTETEDKRRLHIRNLRTGEERELAGDIGVRSPSWSPDGRSILAPGFDNRRRAQGDYRGGLYTIDVERDQATLLVQFPAHQRGWAGSTGEWSLDGKAVFYLTPSGIIRRDLDSGQEKQLYRCDSLSRALSLSPDGKRLAFCIGLSGEGQGQVMSIPVVGGQPTELCRFEETTEGFRVPKKLVWTPDGNYILFAKNEKKGSSIWRVASQGGVPQMILESDHRVHSLCVHPNGEQMAYSTYIQEGAIWVMENFLPGAPARVAKPAHQPDFKKIWIPTKPGNGVLSPDGGKLAFISEGSVWVVPVHGKVSPDIAGEPVRLTEPMGAWDVASFLAWSADGNWIAFNASDEKKEAIYVIPSSGGTPRKVPVEPRRRAAYSYRLSLSPDGKVVAFCSRYIEESEAEPPKGPRGFSPSVRGSFIYTVPVAGGEVKRLTDTWSGEQAFSPDGKKIAFVKYDTLKSGELYVVPAAGGSPIQVTDSDPQRVVRGPVWSPDSKTIAFIAQRASGRNEVCIIPVSDTGKASPSPTKIQLPLNSYDVLAGWTADNKIGVFLHNPDPWAIHTVPASGGQAVQVTPSGWATHPQWSPDGQRIYFRWDGGAIASVPSDGGGLSIVRIQSDPPVGLPYPGSGNAVSPDGKQIVFSAAGSIYTVAVGGGRPKEITEGRYPCWSPDGKSIAFIRTHQRPVKTESGWNIYIVSSKGGDIRQLTSQSDAVRRTHIDWSPDGKSIAYFAEDRTMRILPVQGGQSRVVARAEELKNHDELAWSPDGGKLVYSSKGRIWIVSSDGGEPEEIRTGLDAKAGHVSWSPDGQKLAFTAIAGGEEELHLMENFLPEASAPVARPEPEATTLRKLAYPWGGFAILSPDGRYLCDVDWDVDWETETEKLVLRELATDKVQILTTTGHPEYAAISPTSAQVAYLCHDANWAHPSLYTVGLDGSDRRCVRQDDCLVPKAWSADGSKILALEYDKDPKQLVWVSVADGSLEHIVSVDKGYLQGEGYPGKFDVSPDGRFLAYARLQAEETVKRDLVIFDLKENRETAVADHPANDRLLGWTPDGSFIFFASDRAGTWDGWLQRVTDGAPQGFPELVRRNIGDVRAIGFGQGGSFYYHTGNKPMWDVFIAALDLDKGRVLAAPMPVRQTGTSHFTDWSPDGQKLAYCTGGPGESKVIHIRDLATGEEREIDTGLPGFAYPHWSPDGQFILGATARERPHSIYRIDAQTGERTELVRSATGPLWECELSPDGETLLYVRDDPNSRSRCCVVRNLATGHEEDLVQATRPLRLREVALSPNGQQLAYVTSVGGSVRSQALKIVPAEGGEPRELLQFAESEKMWLGSVAWTPDGEDVLFVKRLMDDKGGELWRISARGGEPRKVWAWNKPFSCLSVHPDGQRIAFHTSTTASETWVMENFLPKAVAAARE